MKIYCEVCEKETEHKIEELEEQYECDEYSGERLVAYWLCQECYCPTERVSD
jgi:hypothetical protein